MRDGLDYNSELEYVKKLDQKPVPAPAEPVAGETKKCQCGHSAIDHDGGVAECSVVTSSHWNDVCMANELEYCACDKFSPAPVVTGETKIGRDAFTGNAYEYETPAPAVAAPAEGKPKDVLEDLTWKILSATDSDDIRGYVIQAAAHGVELGRAETASTPPPAEDKFATAEYEADCAAGFDGPGDFPEKGIFRHRDSPPADLDGKLREFTVKDAERVIHKIEACEGMASKLLLLRNVLALGRAEGLEEALELVRDFSNLNVTSGELANLLMNLFNALK